MGIIKGARKYFANTPVQKWPITTFMYRKVFRFGYSEDEITIPFRNVMLTIPSKDTTIVPGLVGGFYEKIELDIFERLAKKSLTIFDIGGSIGDYTCVGASRLPEIGRLTVFEPVPENITYIKRNLAQNKLTDKVMVEAAAVGDTDGEMTIFMVEDSVGTHSASASSAAGISKNGVKVPVVALDSYVKKHSIDSLDILKIDIEGYDGFALRGAKTILSDLKPTVFIEFVADNLVNCGFDPQEFLELLVGEYGHIYVVDEPKNTLKLASKDDLQHVATHSMNANLILTNKPEHLKIIQEWLK